MEAAHQMLQMSKLGDPAKLTTVKSTLTRDMASIPDTPLSRALAARATAPGIATRGAHLSPGS